MEHSPVGGWHRVRIFPVPSSKLYAEAALGGLRGMNAVEMLSVRYGPWVLMINIVGGRIIVLDDILDGDRVPIVID